MIAEAVRQKIDVVAQMTATIYAARLQAFLAHAKHMTTPWSVSEYEEFKVGAMRTALNEAADLYLVVVQDAENCAASLREDDN
jgi:hypothetical protein